MDAAIALLNESGRWLVTQLGRMSVELAILAGIVLIVLYVLRVKSPALRHLFWGLLLAKPVVTFLVASPLSLYGFFWPTIPEVFYSPAPAPVQMESTPFEAPVQTTFVPEVPPLVPPRPETPSFWRQIDRYGLISAVWALVSSLFGLRLLLGCAYVSFLRSTAMTQREGSLADLVAEAERPLRMRRRVRIATTRVAHGPVLAGIFRPVILLPEHMAEALTPKQMKLVITHELAHARRWDNLVLLIQRLAEMFFFFHPVVWFCGWMMRREAEAACDDMVVSAYGDADGAGAAAYADSLTRVAEMKCGITHRLLVNTFAAAESNFHRRISRILSGRRTRMTLWISLATGAALVFIGLTGLPTVLSKSADKEYWMEFDQSSVAGLHKNSMVTYIGVPVGKVKAVQITGNDRARVEVLIDPTRVTLREGVKAQLETFNTLSAKPIWYRLLASIQDKEQTTKYNELAVSLTDGDPNASELAPGSKIPTRTEGDSNIKELLNKVPPVLETINNDASDVSGFDLLIVAKEAVEAKWDGINSFTAVVESKNDRDEIRGPYSMFSRISALKNAAGVLMYRIETDKIVFEKSDRKGWEKHLKVFDGKDEYREMHTDEGIEVRVRKDAFDTEFGVGMVGMRSNFEECFKNDTFTLLPDEEIDGKPVYVFEGQPKRSEKAAKYRLYIDKETGVELKYERGEKRSILSDLKLNGPVDASLFNYTPPAGAKIIDSAVPETQGVASSVQSEGEVAGTFPGQKSGEAAPGPAPQSETEAKMFLVPLKEDSSVELIAVRRYGSDDRSFWRPDGTPLADPPPFDHTEPTVTGKETKYELAFRITGIDLSLPMEFDYDGQFTGPTTPLADNLLSIPGFMGYVIFVKGDPQSVSIGLKIASADWTPVLSHDNVDSPGGHSTSEYSATFAEPYVKDDRVNVVLTFTGSLAESAVRFVAMDKSGQPHTGILSNGVSGAEKVLQNTYSFTDVKLEDIQTFLVETCPWQEVQFTNISLAAGRHTDCNVSAKATVKISEEQIQRVTLNSESEIELFLSGLQVTGNPDKGALQVTSLDGTKGFQTNALQDTFPISGPFRVAPLVGCLDEAIKQDWKAQGITGGPAIVKKLQEVTLEMMRKGLDSVSLQNVALREGAHGSIIVEPPAGIDIKRVMPIFKVPGTVRFCPAASREETLEALRNAEKEPRFQGRIEPLIDLDTGKGYVSIKPDQHKTAMDLLSELQPTLPENKLFMCGSRQDPNALYLLDFNASMPNVKVRSAEAVPDENDPGHAIILATLSDEDAQRFGDLTQSLIGKNLAVLVDSDIQTVPMIRDRITSQIQLSGNYTPEEAAELAARLLSPGYPVPLAILPGLDKTSEAFEERTYENINEAVFERMKTHLLPVYDPNTGEELSTLRYDKASGRITVRNLPDNFAWFERLLSQLGIPKRIKISSASSQLTSCANNLKQCGLVLKLYANEAPQGMFPPLSPLPGCLMWLKETVYPEYLADPTILICPTEKEKLQQSNGTEKPEDKVNFCFDNSTYWYLGYAIPDEKTGLALTQAYRKQVENGGDFNEDMEDDEGKPIRRLQEGVERFITDIQDPGASARLQSKLPVFIERPGHHDTQINVLFMDGHVEKIAYPGDFPVSQRFIEALGSLDALRAQEEESGIKKTLDSPPPAETMSATTTEIDTAPQDAVPMSCNAPQEDPFALPVGPTSPQDRFEGQVVGEDGKPLAGVLVNAWSWCPGDEATTDAEGAFALDDFGLEQKSVEVLFSKEGYSPVYMFRQPLGRLTKPLVMTTKTYLEGKVVDSLGSPASNAIIRVNGGPRQAEGVLIGDTTTQMTAGPDGAYRIYVQHGNYTVTVTNGTEMAVVSNVAIAKDEAKSLDIQLSPAPVFRAKVVDSITGAPVEGVRLYSWRLEEYEGVSNAQGEITISGLPMGKFEFQVDGEDRDITRWWSEEAADKWQQYGIDNETLKWQRNFDDLTFPIEKDMAPVTITVEKGVRIRGKVVDPDGKPVAGATVAPALTGTGNSLTGDTRFSVRSGEDGSYDILLPASNSAVYNLVCHDGDYEEWRTWANGVAASMITQPSDVKEGVELQLQRPCIVRGKVVDAGGVPLVEHEVRACPFDKNDNRYYVPETRTDKDGLFELKYVAPGKHFVQAAPYWLDPEKAPEGSSQVIEATQEKPVEGIVLKSKPETDAASANEMPRSTVENNTDVQPVYDENIPQEREGVDNLGKQEEESVESKTTRGKITGVVTNGSTGQAIAGAYVGVGDCGDSGGSNHDRHRQEGLYAQGKTDDAGQFTLDGLALGREHLLIVTHPDFVREDRLFFQDTADSGVPFMISLKPAAKITATVVDVAGTPAGDAAPGRYFFWLEALDGHKFIPPGRDPHLTSFASPLWLKSQTGDSFTFSELDAGQYSVNVLREVPVTPTDEAMAAENTAVTVTYHGGITVEVENGQSKTIPIAPVEHGTRFRIGIPNTPDIPATVPRFLAITRDPAFTVPGGAGIPIVKTLEDPQLMLFAQGVFYSTGLPGELFVAKDRSHRFCTFINLPPGRYCVLGGAPLALAGALVEVESNREEVIELGPNPGPREKGSARTPYRKIDPQGGKVVDGLQAVLQTEKKQWVAGETPTFRVDLLEVGEGSLGIDDPPLGMVLEYDSIQYTVSNAGMMSAPGLFGRGVYGLQASLDEEFIDSEKRPLTLTPGKHTVRVAFHIHPPQGAEGAPAMVFSNPVSIEIGGVAVPGSTATSAYLPLGTLLDLDQPAEGVQVGFPDVNRYKAIGDFRVDGNLPEDKRLGLLLNLDGIKDLSLLWELPEDRIELLGLPFNDAHTALENNALSQITRLKGLKSLYLDYFSAPKESLHFLKNLPVLETLAIQPELLDADAAVLIAQLPALKRLRIAYTDKEISSYVLFQLAKCTALEELWIEGRALESSGLEELAKLPALRLLRIGPCEFDVQGLRHLAAFPALRRLEFYDLSDEGMKHLPLIPSLKELDIQGKHDGFSPEAFAAVARIPGLESLEVTSRYSDDCIAQLKPMITLKSLGLHSLFQDEAKITDAALAHLGGIPSLESLDIYTGNFTDAGWAALTSLPNLKHLYIPNVQIMDAALVHIGKITSLEDLRIRASTITNEGLVHLESLAALKEISFFLEGKFTDEGIARLREKVPSLTEVILDPDQDTEPSPAPQAPEQAKDATAQAPKTVCVMAGGQPASEAEVAVARPGWWITCHNGKIRDAVDHRRPATAETYKTDSSGRLALPDIQEPFLLVVTHPFGYALVSGKYPDAASIALTPWGAVEGQLQLSDVKCVNTGMAGTTSQYFDKNAQAAAPSIGDNEEIQIMFTSESRTDENAHYVLSHLMAGTVTVYPLIEDAKGIGNYVNGLVTDAKIVSGATTLLNFGQARFQVAGRLVGREGFAAIDWTGVKADLILEAPHIGMPGDEEQWKAQGAFANSDKGRLYFQDVPVAADGTFHIDEVPEGWFFFRFFVPPAAAGLTDTASKSVGQGGRSLTLSAASMKPGEPMFFDLGAFDVAVTKTVENTQKETAPSSSDQAQTPKENNNGLKLPEIAGAIAAHSDVQLVFPDDITVGELYTRPAAEPFYAPFDPASGRESWKYHGEARGTVEIPSGLQIKLEVPDAKLLQYLTGLQADSLQSLSLRGSNLHDEELSSIARLTGLRALDCEHNASLTDKGLNYLSDLKQLEWLHLGLTGVSLGEAGPFPGLEQLWYLDLNQCPLSMNALNVISKISGLRWISLEETNVNVAGLAQLTSCPRLEGLNLCGCSLDQSPISSLAGLKNLHYLDLSNEMQIIDAELSLLTGLKNLQFLSLRKNKGVTDAGMAALSSLKELRYLDLRETSITNAALASLKSLPDLSEIQCAFTAADEQQADAINSSQKEVAPNPRQASSNPNALKVGLVMSHFTATGPSWRGEPYGYEHQASEEFAAVLDQMNFDVYAVIEPGTATKGALPRILAKTGLWDKTIELTDLPALLNLNVIVIKKCNNAIPEMIGVLRQVAESGVGIVDIGGFGRVTPGYNAEFEDFYGVSNTGYSYYLEVIDAPVLQQHPILGDLKPGDTIAIDVPDGITVPNGVRDGAVLLGGTDKLDDNFCTLMVREVGKGRMVVGNWYYLTIPRCPWGPYGLYLRCINWAAHQPVDAKWAPEAPLSSIEPIPATDTTSSADTMTHVPEYSTEAKIISGPVETIEQFVNTLETLEKARVTPENTRMFRVADKNEIQAVLEALEKQTPGLELLSAPRITMRTAEDMAQVEGDKAPETLESPSEPGQLRTIMKGAVSRESWQKNMGPYSASLVDFLQREQYPGVIADMTTEYSSEPGVPEPVPTRAGIAVAVAVHKTDDPQIMDLRLYFNSKEREPKGFFESPVTLATPFPLGQCIGFVTENCDPEKKTLVLLTLEQVNPSVNYFYEEKT